jgi:3',5'-cyclic AMP phosphodiesterase CpdA
MSYWVLHIADPHFSRSHFDDKDPSTIGRNHAIEVKDVLREHDLSRERFHALVFSGDFTFAYEPRGFTAATAFVKELSNLAEPGAIVVIPGNHDVDISNCLPIGRFSVPVEKTLAEAKFRGFLDTIEQERRVGGNATAPDRFLSMPLRVEIAGQSGLVLLGMNSSRVERWDAQGWGYVGLDQVRELGMQLLAEDSPAKEGDVVVGITHHNLLPVWDLPLGEVMRLPGQRKLSFTVDSASVLHALNDLGVAALLHGHTHVISPKHVRGYGGEDERSTMVFGAGSLGLWHPSCEGHHIQLLEINSTTISIHDLTCETKDHQRNGPRLWTPAAKQEVEIYRWWNLDRAQRALKAMRPKARAAEIDWLAMESWSRLRAYFDTERRARTLDQIHSDVQALPGGESATREHIQELIQMLLFESPPDEESLSGLTLQEYLLDRLS